MEKEVVYREGSMVGIEVADVGPQDAGGVIDGELTVLKFYLYSKEGRTQLLVCFGIGMIASQK